MTRFDVDYSLLPQHMQSGVEEYVERGKEPGGFLYAVLTNDLVESFARADATNTAAMPLWAAWLYNEAPSTCWGSKERVDRWVNAEGHPE